ncbi:MAG: hypothetical protein DI565_00705 [Ancylobacter novellus]|uniref:Uncharacterized protein n=1 Tax=Ancylobacter novellus TaxID=921 RepID=A0A2W5MGD4_ANCNO|nr:MAG: hypothetical protein DI565_00705 [Ancylobacter novellus]
MNFSEAIAAQLAGETIRRGLLVEFDFASGVKRVWNGEGALQTSDGKIWEGLFGLGSVSGLAQAINGSAPEILLSVSGVDPDFANRVKGESAEYLNRAVIVFSQFFDESWQTLDAPFAIVWAKMRGMKVRREVDDDVVVRTVTIKAETPFGETKRRPRNGYCTDRDQQTRYPGDRGCERTPGLESKLIEFPT